MHTCVAIYDTLTLVRTYAHAHIMHSRTQTLHSHMHTCTHARTIDSVRSLILPGVHNEKITHLGGSLANFTRLRHLDLSCNAVTSLEVCCVRLHVDSFFCELWYNVPAAWSTKSSRQFCRELIRAHASTHLWGFAMAARRDWSTSRLCSR